MVERTKPVVEGLGHTVDGYEYHYPGEINEANVEAIQRALGDHHDIYCIATGLHTWLAVYHPRIYRYNKGATILQVGESGLDFDHPPGAFTIWWQSGDRNVRVWPRGPITWPLPGRPGKSSPFRVRMAGVIC